MLSRRTLLLADDSPTVQKVVSLTFADEGMQVVTASGGAEALAKIGETVPDVLLADVHMPAPNGYELCARVKRDARTSRVPVLLLVGTFEPFDEAEARACGADGVLTKPFQSIRELVHKVGGLISGHPEPNKDSVASRDDDNVSAEAAAATAAAHEPPPFAATDGVQPPPAFAGLDTDDESIESVPADDYVAAGRARAEDAAAEFVTADVPLAREAAGAVEASSFGAAAGMRAGNGYPAARFVAPQAGAGFVTRPPHTASEDSLLELGELTPPRSRAAADADYPILDIGDEEEAADAPPVAARGSAEAFGAVQAEGGTSAEPPAPAEVSAATEISPANLSNAWGAAPRIEVSPAPAAFPEPAPDSSAAAESLEREYEIEVESSEAAHPASGADSVEQVETQDTPAAAASARMTAEAEVAHPEVEHSRAGAEIPTGAAQLSPEMVDAVARRVVELMSDAAVREIAWEVVPDLAERLIRERLEQENTRPS